MLQEILNIRVRRIAHPSSTVFTMGPTTRIKSSSRKKTVHHSQHILTYTYCNGIHVCIKTRRHTEYHLRSCMNNFLPTENFSSWIQHHRSLTFLNIMDNSVTWTGERKEKILNDNSEKIKSRNDRNKIIHKIFRNRLMTKHI